MVHKLVVFTLKVLVLFTLRCYILSIAWYCMHLWLTSMQPSYDIVLPSQDVPAIMQINKLQCRIKLRNVYNTWCHFKIVTIDCKPVGQISALTGPQLSFYLENVKHFYIRPMCAACDRLLSLSLRVCMSVSKPFTYRTVSWNFFYCNLEGAASLFLHAFSVGLQHKMRHRRIS